MESMLRIWEILIPVIKDCVLAVDTEEGIIRVHLLKGLID